MRGFHSNPAGMNTMKGERGWRARQEAALSRQAARVRMIEDAVANAPVEAEKRRVAEVEAAERRAAYLRLRVTCPCCGTGAVSIPVAERALEGFSRSRVDENAQIRARLDKDHRACPVCAEGQVDGERAERIVAALDALPADYEAFAGNMQILYGIATGQTYHGVYALRVANGAIYPRRADPVPATESAPAPAAPPVPAVPVVPVAPTRKARPAPIAPPWLDPDAVLED